MSGFVGIVNLDGAPVDRVVLERMTQSLAFRGPDEQDIWYEGAVGLGHALLRTTHEATREHQPATFDGRFWIVADARIDARAELTQKINLKRGHGPEVSLATPDPELILRAFDLWGESCIDHLLGDFSFAIWDASRRRLFCARDHFGVKLLYYAKFGEALIFSNTLDTLRLYPDFSPVLCDAAIADFLLIGINLHPTLTPFEQILRLPPAHTLVASSEYVRLERYWSFPIEEPLHYRRSADYVDEFRGLLTAAVGDRLRTDRASINLSGGLDSPTVAAEAVAQLGVPENLLAMTYGFRELFPDPEPPLARMVAEYLRIPYQFTAFDDYKLLERWESPGFHHPWPADVTLEAAASDTMDQISKHGRVLLTGEGGDPGLGPSMISYRGLGVFSLLWQAGKYILTHGHHPRIGFRVTWQKWRGIQHKPRPPYPQWLDQDLEKHLGLQARWITLLEGPPTAHPFRPDSHASLLGTHWSAHFEIYGADYTHVPVEARHPLLDVRLQRFFLRLPVLPWCADKELLRVAMRDHLPEAILRRPKSPVHGNPMTGMLAQINRDSLTNFTAAPEFRRYVDQERMRVVGSELDPASDNINLRPINLNYWLRQVGPRLH